MSPLPLVIIVQIVQFSFCTGVSSNVPSWIYFCDVVPRFVLSASLLILAVIQTLKQSVQMYKATKQWQPNKYMQQLVSDGVLYFLVYVPIFPSFISIHYPSPLTYHTLVCLQKTDQLDIFPRNVLFNIVIVLQGTPEINSTLWFFLSSLCYTALCPIIPRFIIGVREQYDRDLCPRRQGIDTGFGVSSQPIASGNAVVSAIAFADGAPGQDQDQVMGGDEDEELEAIQLEGRGDRAHQV